MKETIHYQKEYSESEIPKYNNLIEKIEEISIRDSIFQSSKCYKHFYWMLDKNLLTRTHLNLSRKDQKSDCIAKATIEKTGQYPTNQSEIETILLREGFNLLKSK